MNTAKKKKQVAAGVGMNKAKKKKQVPSRGNRN